MTSNHRVFLASAALVAVSSLSSARAQDVSAGPPPPAMTCDKPGDPPMDRQGAEIGRFNKRFETYKTCVNDYVKTTGAKSEAYQNQANAYRDAANNTINDYNAFVTAMNARDAAKK